MPLLSIITPLYQPDPAHLQETARGVTEQELPPDWAVEWVVQEDGRHHKRDELQALDAVSYDANGAHLGVAATRNIALSRSSGDLIQVLDHDDVLLPHALATLIPRFDDPSTHWAVAQADDLAEDGTRTPWASHLPFGPIAPGMANSDAIQNGGNWAVHCAGLMIRVDVLRALGGWVASWGDDDIAMFAGLSEATTGYNDPAVTWLYRQHPGQLHRTRESQRLSAKGRDVALQRVIASRSARLTVTAEPFHRAAAPNAGPAAKD